MPDHCPVCSSNVAKEGAYYYCTGQSVCLAQLRGAIEHFASKSALNIEGLGKKTVAQLVESRLVRSLADLYRLTKAQLLTLEGFADRSASLLLAAIDGTLLSADAEWIDQTALAVVMAAQGYPGEPRRGGAIAGLQAASVDGALVFHAGTAMRDGRLVAAGGRVLDVVGLGGNVSEAAAKAYAAVDRVVWPDGFWRRDIGWRTIRREAEAGAAARNVSPRQVRA